MKKMVLLLLSSFLALGTALAQSRVSPSSMDELMQKSGLWVQIGQIEPMMQEGILKAQEENPGTKESDIWPLREAIAAAYAPDVLRKDIRDHLSASLTPHDVKSALVWLSSDLGKRLTAMEEEAGQAVELLQDEQSVTQLLNGLSPKRLDLLKQFAKATRAGEATASIVINTTVGMTYGMSLTAPKANKVDMAEVKKVFEGQRAQMVQMYEGASIAQFAIIYQSVSDRDMSKYLAFAESAAGKKYHDATLRALEKALTKAATEMGRTLGRPSKVAGSYQGEFIVGVLHLKSTLCTA